MSSAGGRPSRQKMVSVGISIVPPGPRPSPADTRAHQPPLRRRRSQPHFTTLPCPCSYPRPTCGEHCGSVLSPLRKVAFGQFFVPDGPWRTVTDACGPLRTLRDLADASGRYLHLADIGWREPREAWPSSR